MGNSQSIQKINFEYMQDEIIANSSYIISTLPNESQGCLIQGTLSPSREVEILNNNLKNKQKVKINYLCNECV